jgi:TOMM system kinase/cyclase fusion protein
MMYFASLKTALAPDYELLTELGHGSYGTVFKAIQQSTSQLVAIKVQELDDTEAVDVRAARLGRFDRETKLCAALSHPNIVRILDKGQRGQFLFIVFELVPGTTLGELLREGALQVDHAVFLMSQVLDALEGAHHQAIVHRDLKPENIMVADAGTQRYAKVLDFGAGAFLPGSVERGGNLTRSQEILGTPCYSAPEQLRGDPATERSDLYAWGLVFLECLTGRRVLDGATLAEVFHRQLSGAEIVLPPAIATHPLGEVLRRALAKAPQERIASARELRRLLASTRTGDLVGPISSVPPPARPAKTLTVGIGRSGEQRQATLLCCSLNVVARGGQAADLEALDALQRDQLSLCGDVIARFGGVVAGVLANRLIGVFGVPQASDSDARRAARAALELASRMNLRRALLASQRGLDIELRIGIHTGIVIVDLDGAPSGPAFNVAARLESLADPNTTWVSDATRNLIHRHLRLQPVEPARQVDLPQAIRAYSLVGEPLSDSVHGLREGAPSSTFVGRAAELELLRQHFRAAQAGHGSAVLIRGEPGIGKSRIVHELRVQALQSGALSFDAQCLPEDVNTALRPVLAVLRQHFDLEGAGVQGGLERLNAALVAAEMDPVEVAPVVRHWLAVASALGTTALQPATDKQRALVLEAFEKILCSAGRHRGGLVVVEDLHWADPTTLELLRRMAAVASNHPVLVLLTARSGFDAEPAGIKVIELSKLEREAVERLIQASAGSELDRSAVELIADRTDGVPLFVEELTRSMLEQAEHAGVAAAPVPVPAGLRDLLNSRLDRTGRAKETAQLAAVIGRDFDLDLLSVVSERTPETLQAHLDVLAASDLVRRQLHAEGSRYVFRHALIRDAAAEGLLASTRKAVHQKVAEALESRFSDRVKHDPARLAWHFELAQLSHKAVAYRLEAGRQAASASAYKEAIEHLNSGLRTLAGTENSPERAATEIDLRNALGAALLPTAGYAADAVVDTFVRSRDLLAVAASSSIQRFTTLKGLWTFHNARADYEAALDFCRQLQSLAESENSPEFFLNASQCRTQTALLLGRFTECVRSSEECERWFDPKSQQENVLRYGGDPWLTAIAAECLAQVLLGNVGRARIRLDTALQAAARMRSPNHEAMLVAQGAALELFVGSCSPDPKRAMRLCFARTSQALELASKHGLDHAAAYAQLIGAMAACVTGDDGSTEAMSQAIAMWRMAGIQAALGWHYAYLAQGLLVRGDFEGAAAAADSAVAHSHERGEGYGASEAYRVKALVLSAAEGASFDEHHSVLAFERAIQYAREQDAHWLELRAAYSFVRCARKDGHRQARAALQEAISWFEQTGSSLDTDLVRACRDLTVAPSLLQAVPS